MGFLDAALQTRSYRVGTSNPRNPAWWLIQAFGGGETTSSGIRVDPEIAMRFSAVYAAARILGDDVGGLPVPVFRQGPKRKVKDNAHPAYELLNWQANPEMSAIDFRSALQGQAVLRGNAFAEIEWDQAMRPKALWPLAPHRMRLLRNGFDLDIADARAGELVYVYTLPSGQTKVFASSLIFHHRGFSPDGLWGYSSVRLHREGIGLALAAQEYLGRFYSNDGRPGAVLEHPKELTDKARKNIEDSWPSAHQGLSNAHRMAILEEGMKLAAIPMTFDDAQFLQSRQFEITEWARSVRIPPHKLFDLTRSTDNNIEHQSIEYVVDGVRPWCKRWDQALRRSRIVVSPFETEHNVDGLLQGDSAARAALYHSLRQDGAITANGIAERENLPISDDPAADQLLIPLNMIPASSYDDEGMTKAQRLKAAADLVRVGFDPAAVMVGLNLPAINHTGLVPTTIQIDPASLPDQTGAAA